MSALARATMVAALGGLLFGYDTAVISGAIGLLREFFDLTSAQMGWAASSALVGCIAGAALAGWLSARVGRRTALQVAAALFAISAFGTAVPDGFTEFVVYRIVGGIGVGIASMVSPMYIAEIAPAALRGRLVGTQQFAIIFGMLLVYIANYVIALQGDGAWNLTVGWRYMFGSELVPALAFFLLLFFIPESPRYLVWRGRSEEALAVLQQTLGGKGARGELVRVQKALREGTHKLVQPLRPYAHIIAVGMALSILQQVTGINVFLYYAPEIFKDFGSGLDSALFQTMLVGAVNLAFTVVAMVTVDRWGRKPLLIGGSAGMGVCLTAIGWAAYHQAIDGSLLIFVLGYIACFALSLGPVVWILLAEIFPAAIKSRALAIAVAVQWISNFAVSQTFPMLAESSALKAAFHGAFPFWLYAGMCLVTVVVVQLWVPETKGAGLEAVEKLWARRPSASRRTRGRRAAYES